MWIEAKARRLGFWCETEPRCLRCGDTALIEVWYYDEWNLTRKHEKEKSLITTRKHDVVDP